MKKAEDLNLIEYAIYYFNKILVLIICAFIVYVNWQTNLIVVVVSYIVFKVLWFIRKNIYELGLSRFYLLTMLFYLSMFLSIFVSLDSNHYAISITNVGWNHIDEFMTYIILNLPRLFHFKHIIFSLALAVIIYVANTELSRKIIQERDLIGIQVDKKRLYNINLNIHVACLITIGVTLFFVNWLALLILVITEILLTVIDRRTRIIFISSLLLFGLLFLVFFRSEIVYLPSILFKSINKDSLLTFIKLQFSFKMFLAIMSYCLLPYVILKLVFELAYNKNTANKIKEQNVEKDARVKYKSGDFDIGVNLYDNTIVSLTDKELNQHLFVMGTTGAGKTTAILNLVVHAAQKNYPTIFICGKGQLDLVERLASIAKDNNKVFRLFSLRPEAVGDKHKQYVSTYNPFSAGTFTEWKNRILALFAEVKGKGQQHFALLEEDLINSVAQILYKMDRQIDLDFLYQMLSNVDFLIGSAQKNGEERLANKLLAMDKELIQDVAIMLSLFVESSYGRLFQTKGSDSVISLRSALENNEMVLFLLDSSAYKSDTEKIAKLIINDINSTFSELAQAKTSYCVFDEFASYASGNLADTVSLMRSKGMHAIIGTQSIISVSLKSEETRRVAEELKSCCNTYLCLPINNEQDAETVSKLFNTTDNFEVTAQVDVTIGGTTGMGSSKMIKEFNVHPEQLKNLSAGEGFLYRKVAKLKPIKIKVKNSGY